MRLTAVFLLATSLILSAKTIDKDFNQTFNISPGTVLHLKHGDGDVDIEPWENDQLEINVRYYAKISSPFRNGDDDFRVDFEQRGDDIYVTGHEPIFQMGLFSQIREEYRYTIKAPAYLMLECRGADGDVEIEGWRSDIEIDLADGDVFLNNFDSDELDIKIVDGDVDLRNIKGKLYLKSVDGNVNIRKLETPECEIRLTDGDIRMQDADGAFYVRTVDGDVELLDARAAKVTILTVDGDIRLDLLETSDILANVETGDGDVIISLEKSISAEIRCRTRDGSIHSRLQDQDRDQDVHDYFGRLGDGNGLVEIHTADGDIDLNSF